MADGGVFFDLKADASGMLNALSLVHAALEKNTNAVTKQKDAIGNLDKDAKRVMDSLMTDQDKYNATLQKLQALRAADKISEEAYRQAVTKATAELWKKNEALKKASVIQAELVHTSQAWSDTVGDRLFGGITKAGIALMAVQKVQSTITDLVQREYAAREAGGDKRLAIAQQLASLAQYENRGELRARAAELTGTGAFTPAQALETMETIQAADLTAQFASLKRLGASMLFGEGFGDFIKAAGSMRQAFKEQAGGIPQITSAALGAGYGAPAKAREVLQWAAKAAGDLKTAGFSPEQALALTDITSRIYGANSPEALQAFGRAVAKQPDLRGRRPEEIVASINQRNLAPEEIYKIFPEAASKVFFQTRDNLADYLASEKRIQQYVAGNYGEAATQGAFEMNAGVRATLEARGKEEQTRVFGQGESAARRGSLMREGMRFFGSRLLDSVSGMATPVTLPGGGLLRAAGGTPDQLQEGLINVLSNINNNTAETNKILSKQNQAAPQAVPNPEQ